jgi:hypothetical protein
VPLEKPCTGKRSHLFWVARELRRVRVVELFEKRAKARQKSDALVAAETLVRAANAPR